MLATGRREVAAGLTPGEEAHDPTAGLLIIIPLVPERYPRGEELDHILDLIRPNALVDGPSVAIAGLLRLGPPIALRRIPGAIGDILRIPVRHAGEDHVRDLERGAGVEIHRPLRRREDELAPLVAHGPGRGLADLG